MRSTRRDERREYKKQQYMRNEMYDKNTEKRQHLDARNETNAINLFGLAFLCGNADEKWTGAHRKRSVKFTLRFWAHRKRSVKFTLRFCGIS